MIYRIVKLDGPYYIKASSFEEAIKKADILSFEKKQPTDDERMVDDASWMKLVVVVRRT